MLESCSMLPATIHCLWVGPPTKEDPTAVAGYDIAGPIKMAKQLRQQQADEMPANAVKFWCLKAYVESYSVSFSQFGVAECIEICAVEDLLDEKQKDILFLRDVELLKEKLLQLKDGTVAHRVTFKDHFSFFILANQAGYFFDTNVFPLEGERVSLPSETYAWTVRSPDSPYRHDYFIMYIPRIMCEEALNALCSYRPDCQGAKCFQKFSPPISYEQMLAMGIDKFSYKSYINMQSSVSGLFFWLQEDYILYLQSMLEYGDLNAQVAYPTSMAVLESVDFYRAFGEELGYSKDQEKYYVDKASKHVQRVPNDFNVYTRLSSFLT